MTPAQLCPYWSGGTAEPRTGATYAAYCRRPDGAVRIPARDETRRFCATGHHGDCPGYRGARVDEMFPTAHA